MPRCSIITAAGSSNVDHTLECWESITAQLDLGNCELEWCIQEDGTDPSLREILPDDERIRYGVVGERYGIATDLTSRSAGPPARSCESLIRTTSFFPFALRDQLQAFDEHRHVAWVAGRAADLLPGGGRQLVDVDLPAGLISPGKLVDLWSETGVFPVHAAEVALRATVARTFGGWAALPRSEDLSLLAAVSTIFFGVYLSTVTFLYRHWPG